MLSPLSPSEIEHLLRDIPTDQMASYSPMAAESGRLETEDAPPKKRCRSAEMDNSSGPSSSGQSKEAQVLKAAEQLASLCPTIDFDDLLSRLNSAENVDVETERILAEINDQQPGPSNSFGGRNSPELPADVVEEAMTLLNSDEREILRSLCQMFPDADPKHVVNLIAQAEEKNIGLITDQMFKNGYPRLRERKDKENEERRRAAFLSGEDFNPAEFLRIYPNPDEYFLSDQRDKSDLYLQHANAFLCNQFRDMRSDFFKKLLLRHDNKLLPTYRDIMEAEERSKGPSNRRKKRKNFGFSQFAKERRLLTLSYPEKIDETFFREMQYCLNESVVKDYLRAKEEERNGRIANARAAGELVECGICMDDEVLPEEIVRCDGAAEQHGFCRPCTKQHAETQIGNGAHFVRCMADDCDAGRLTLGALQVVMDGKALQLLVRRAQQDELHAAKLDNMDSCPFCDFAMIIDNDLERLFRCLNPECLRESCRKCREPSHIPLRCEEVEQDEDTKMRTFIENRMAEAMIRKCPKCKKPIIKSEGCNKMACPCGAYFCYYCNAELPHVNPYAHFSATKCPQSTPIQQLHDDVAKKAGEEAKALYSRDHSISARRPPKDVNIDTLVDNAAKTITQPALPPVMRPFLPVRFAPIIPPAIVALRREHTQVRERLANLRWLVETNRLVEDFDARRQLTVEIDYEIARCDGEPPTQEVVDALVQSADALHNQWRRLLAEHRDGVMGRIADYRRYAAQLCDNNRDFVLMQLMQIEQTIGVDNVDGQHEREIARFNLLVPDIERMVNERVQRAEAEEQALKEVPVIELLDDDDETTAGPGAGGGQQPMSNGDRLQLEKLKSSLTVFDRVLIDLNQRLEDSARDDHSRQRITNRLDKAIASRWQVVNRLEELQAKANNASTNTPISVPDSPSPDGSKNGDAAGTTKAATLKHVEVLREQTAKLNAELQAAQQKLAKAPMTESRAALNEMKRLLNERDQSLKRVQEVEAALLRNGASEEDIVGRRDDDQLQLDEQEIQGAADEAGQLARDATAKREAEQRMAIDHKSTDPLSSTSSLLKTPISNTFPFPPTANVFRRPTLNPFMTSLGFLGYGESSTPSLLKPAMLTSAYASPIPSPWMDYRQSTLPYPTYPPANSQQTAGGYWNIWRNNWMTPPPPLNQALIAARAAADFFFCDFQPSSENICAAVNVAVQTAQSSGMGLQQYNELTAACNEFGPTPTAECGRRLVDLFFAFFADVCHASGAEAGNKRAAVAGNWEQYMRRLEQQTHEREERDMAEQLRQATTEVGNLLAQEADLQAQLGRCTDELREARARQTRLEDDLRAAQARNRRSYGAPFTAELQPQIQPQLQPQIQPLIQPQPQIQLQPRPPRDLSPQPLTPITDLTLQRVPERKLNASPALSALLQQCVDDGLEKEVKRVLTKVGARKRPSDSTYPLLTISSDESDDDDDPQADIIYEATMRRPRLSLPHEMPSTSSQGQHSGRNVDANDKAEVDEIIDRHINKRKQQATAEDPDTPKDASNGKSFYNV
uniref:RING-type domain-containing protein n=1 Tax=Plectus sambesii TaxID=2011161 RepID=A0A914VYQ5_9BILA